MGPSETHLRDHGSTSAHGARHRFDDPSWGGANGKSRIAAFETMYPARTAQQTVSLKAEPKEWRRASRTRTIAAAPHLQLHPGC